jgi:hypothetical protein
MVAHAGARGWTHASIVAILYLGVAVVMTWPLAAVMTREIAGDTGDTLFNCWVLLWTSGQALRALRGDMSALTQYWHGNIFYPETLTLAYSEHLTPQMLQALPVLAATGNVILAYNLLFLSTMVLSGLGMYLLIRELTGEPSAAFLAGLAFACAPYRLDQLEHIEVLSSQWMPFAFFGLRRFFTGGRLRALAGGVTALVTQALSCGYYLAYFTPFVVAYCLFELIARGKGWRTWGAVVAAGGAAICLVALFLWPYGQVRRVGDVGVRELGEVQRFSADTHAFATISTRSQLWGSRLQALPRDQGRGFPGFAILTFALLAGGAGIARAAAQAGRREAAPRWRRVLIAGLIAILVLLVMLLGHVLATGRIVQSIGGMVVRYRPVRLLIDIVAVIGALGLLSPPLRRLIRGVKGSTVAFFWLAALAAAWLSLGPTMYANRHNVGRGLYDLFYRWVPGFDGLRVASLHFMLVAFFLAALVGLGAAPLVARRAGRFVVMLGMIAILAESWSVLPITSVPTSSPIYAVIRALPADAVVAEFPFGDPGREILYTFYAGYHRRPIINGYSGFFPGHYVRLVARLAVPTANAEAWSALLESGATYAVVHESARAGEAEPGGISEWLRRQGAREMAAFETDRLFQLR